MIESVPLQVFDSLLMDYHVGHALIAAFALSIVGALPLRSMKVLSVNVIAFGLIFALVPTGIAPLSYKFLGLGLLVIGPMLYVFASR